MADIVIEDIEELESLLSRVYWIEQEFEQMLLWDAFTSVDEKYRDILFLLAHDSEKHKIMLKRVIENIKGIELDTIKENIKERKSMKSRLSMIDEEILAEIGKNDVLALELYTNIHKYTSRSFIESIWEGEDPDTFFKTFKTLMAYEKKHVEILKPYVGKLGRVR